MDTKTAQVHTRVMLVGDGFVSEQMNDRAISGCLDLAERYRASLFGKAADQDVLKMRERASILNAIDPALTNLDQAA